MTMKRTLAILACLLIAGCGSTSQRGARDTKFDFGPLPEAAATAQLPPTMRPIAIPDVTGPALLDAQQMMYRLNYADPLQSRAYTQSEWSSTPLQLLTQRLKSRLSQGGARVLSVVDASAGALLLRVEVDEFSHVFTSSVQNQGRVVLRVSLFDGSKLIDQKMFSRSTESTSADAGGGARALAASTDAITTDIMAWIAALPLPPRPR
jgi:cholesterol transport system auxiliary component